MGSIMAWTPTRPFSLCRIERVYLLPRINLCVRPPPRLKLELLKRFMPGRNGLGLISGHETAMSLQLLPFSGSEIAYSKAQRS